MSYSGKSKNPPYHPAGCRNATHQHDRHNQFVCLGHSLPTRQPARDKLGGDAHVPAQGNVRQTALMAQRRWKQLQKPKLP